VHLFCCSFVKEDISEDMSIDEISAFDEEALEKVIKKDESKLGHYNIDFDAVRAYFKKVQSLYKN